METPTTQADMITLLIGQHSAVDQLFTRMENLVDGADGADGDSDELEKLARQAVISLIQHSVAEEMYLYPTVRKRLSGGGELADREVAEHDEAERTMKRLESLGPSDVEFWPTITTLIRDVRQHVREEEIDLFPRLQEALSADELRALGGKIEKAEKLAPTRPHPAAPSEGTALAALAPGAGMVDRIRDALSGRGR